MVLGIPRKEHLFNQLKKCELWLHNMAFLGHIVSKVGVIVDPKKIVSCGGVEMTE